MSLLAGWQAGSPVVFFASCENITLPALLDFTTARVASVLMAGYPTHAAR